MNHCKQYCTVLLFFLWGCAGYLEAQEKQEEAVAVIARICEQLTADGENELDLTTLEDELNYFTQHPINLNATNKEELERLSFLTDKQIENLLYYLYRQKQMQTIYELQLVDGFDMFLIRNLLPFVYVGEVVVSKKNFPSLNDLLKHGRSELYLRVDRTLEKKQGYRDTDDNEAAIQNDKHYLGDPNYLSFKYMYRFLDKVEAGIVTEKDPGEQLWGRYQKGFDFYSVYFQVHDLGKFKTIVAGNYRANFGLGLVIHPELNFGKSTSITSVLPRSTGLCKSSSTDEYNFLRGLGATYRWKKTDVSVFYSYRFIDGDSTGTSFSYIKTDGLHRTLSTFSRRNNIFLQVMGGNVSVRLPTLYLGLTVVDTRLGRSLEPEQKPYNTFYFRGNHQLAAGVNYRLKVKKLTFFGEEATQTEGGYALLNGLTVSPVSTVNLVAMHRYYSKRYDVLLANAFAEGSRVSNEEGLYIGLEIHPIKRWKITFYSDNYSFPWLRYTVSRPSSGYELFLNAAFVATKNVEMYWRIRYEQKEKNLSGAEITDYTGKYDKASVRYGLSYSLRNELKCRSIVEINRCSKEKTNPSFGNLLSQEISYSFRKFPLSFDLRYEFFDAVDYDNRLYSYERDIAYVFSTPMLYGKGSRWYLNCRSDINRHLSLWLKIASTAYMGQDEIGSGTEIINGNHKTDIRAMVRLKF
jgi:hypothetical protein